MITHYSNMYFLNTLWILKLNEIISNYTPGTCRIMGQVCQQRVKIQCDMYCNGGTKQCYRKRKSKKSDLNSVWEE